MTVKELFNVKCNKVTILLVIKWPYVTFKTVQECSNMVFSSGHTVICTYLPYSHSVYSKESRNGPSFVYSSHYL